MNSSAPMAPGGRFDLFRGGVAPEADVVGHRPGEEEALLGHRDDGAEADREVAQVDVEGTEPSVGSRKRREAGDGGLAGARGPDHRQGLAGGDREVEVVEHGALAVAELDPSEVDLPSGMRRGVGSTGSGTLGASARTPDSFSVAAAAAWKRL